MMQGRKVVEDPVDVAEVEVEQIQTGVNKVPSIRDLDPVLYGGV